MSNYGYGVGALKGIKLSRLRIGEAHRSSDRGISGRVKTFTLIGKGGSRTVPGDKLQSIYGLDSTLYDLNVKGSNLIITGYGYGHGLGLSQWGAEAWRKNRAMEETTIRLFSPIITRGQK